MQIQNPKRTFLIGVIVWLLFFGWWFRGFLFRNWYFRLFSFKSWHHLAKEFHAGWHISAKSDWIFVYSFILAPFIFALLWYLAQKVQWTRLWKKIWRALRWPFLDKKKKRLKEQTAAYEPKQPVAGPFVYKPQAMPQTTHRVQPIKVQSGFLNSSTAMGTFSQPAPAEPVRDFSDMQRMPFPEPPKVEKPVSYTNESFAQMADIPIADVQIPQMEPADEDISALVEKAGYTVFPSVPVEGKELDLVAVSNTELLVILYDNQKGDWLADEESFNDEDPLWFSETDHRVSPVFQLKNIASILQNKLDGVITVIPLLIEKEGTIINAEDMLKTWNDLGVRVCRTGMGGPVELPTGTEMFKEPCEKATPELLEQIKAKL